MAELPDPTSSLSADAQALYERMASVRAHAEGRAEIPQVYTYMFNNPGAAEKVGALGEFIRFGGVLPDDARELAIIRYASRQGFGYEWSHHHHPARLAGVDEATIDAVTSGALPDGLADGVRAVLEVVDVVVRTEEIPAELQQRVVDAYGHAGVVELVVLCGLYSTMGYMVTAFAIGVEPGLPPAPF